jgi:hypothetical protein
MHRGFGVCTGATILACVPGLLWAYVPLADVLWPMYRGYFASSIGASLPLLGLCTGATLTFGRCTGATLPPL